MPRTTPDIKVAAVRSYGAEIDLHGDNYSDAAAHASGLARATGMTVIPPFDDLDVIAGQGTVGLEILRQAPRELGAIFVPVGGGGLISGVAAVIKELRPEVRVIGVQPRDSAAMSASLEQGRRVVLDHVGIFADGVAVRQVGELTLSLCQRYVDEIILVSQDEICAAIQDAFLETRTLLEPAGALSIAGLKRYLARGPSPTPGHAHVVIASGANISLSRLGYIAERAEVGEDREALFAVTIPEQPGSFLAFCARARPAQRHRVQLPALFAQPRPRVHRRARRRRPRRRARSRARSTPAATPSAISRTTSSPRTTSVTWSVGSGRGCKTRCCTPSSSRSARVRCSSF